MKIAVVIASLKGGGAERVTVDLAHWWVHAHEVHLLTFDTDSDETFFELPPQVKRHRLGNPRPANNWFRKLLNNISRIHRLVYTIKHISPDCILSMIDQTNVLSIIAGRLCRIPVVVCEHIDINRYSPGKVWNVLRIITYPFAARVVSVTVNNIDWLRQHFGNRSTVIYNPVHMPPCARSSFHHANDFTVIAAGRLVNQKGFDLLVKAFSSIAAKNPAWKLEIWGEGDGRATLERLIDSCGMRGRIFLRGHSRQLSDQFMRADIFVLSSRFEGFPMVLCEAMACGLPVVSVDCPSGPAEIITPGIDGLLVPSDDVPALAAAVDLLINDEPLRNKLGVSAATSIQRFSIERIGKQWEDLFREIGL